MQDKKFEHQVKDLLYNHKEKAPNVMSNVFEKRTPLYVFKNRLLLHKYKLVAAGLVIGIVAIYLGLTNPLDNKQNAEDQNQSSQELVQIDQSTTKENSSKGIADEADINKTSNSVTQHQSKEDPDVKVIDQERINHLPEPSTNDVQNGTSDHSEGDLPAKIIEMLAKMKSGKDGAGQGSSPDKEYGDPRFSSTDKEKADHEGAYNASEVDEAVSNQTDIAASNKNDEVAENETDEAIEIVKPAEETKKDIIDIEKTIADNTDSASGEELDAGIGDEDFGLPKTNQRKMSLSFSTIVGSGTRFLDQGGDLATVVVRDNTESNALSYGGELLFNYKLHDNVDAFVGLGYFNRREKMVYQNNYQVTDADITSKKVIEYHPVFGTREVTVYDTSYTTRDVQTNGDAKNNYKHVYVPLGLRFTVYDKKFGIHMSVNGGLEVMTKSSGTILNDQYQEVMLGKDFSRTSFGGMLGAGFGASFIVNDRINILTEYRVNYFMSPTNGDKYPIRQQDLGHGLMIGLKYDL